MRIIIHILNPDRDPDPAAGPPPLCTISGTGGYALLPTGVYGGQASERASVYVRIPVTELYRAQKRGERRR